MEQMYIVTSSNYYPILSDSYNIDGVFETKSLAEEYIINTKDNDTIDYTIIKVNFTHNKEV